MGSMTMQGWQRLLFTEICAWIRSNMVVSGTSTERLRKIELQLARMIETDSPNAWDWARRNVPEARA